MKPQCEWGPADYLVDNTGKVLWVGLRAVVKTTIFIVNLVLVIIAILIIGAIVINYPQYAFGIFGVPLLVWDIWRRGKTDEKT